MKVQAKAPGKLFLAGEYAVVEAGQPALVVAINQYLTVSIEKSEAGSVYSSQQKVTVNWTREEWAIRPQEGQTYALIFSAMQVSEDYVRSLGHGTHDCYTLSVDSQLDDSQSGVKYGLGSSGALTVATVRAVLAYYQVHASAYLVFQLSVLAQMHLEMIGSFGDLAAISHGGLVAYHSLDRTWLKEQMKSKSLSQLLALDWEGLSIERLSLPTGLEMLIGWTGRAASTDVLVSQVSQEMSQAEKEGLHADFVGRSKKCLEAIIKACRADKEETFLTGIAENRALLREFASNMGMVIETPALAELCQVALQHGAVAKSSGAGGGDCGVAFVSSQFQKEKIYEEWQEVGIVPLNFAMAEETI